MDDVGNIVYFDNIENLYQKKSSLFLVLGSFFHDEKNYLCLSPIIPDIETSNNYNNYYDLDLQLHNSNVNSAVDFANTIIVESHYSIKSIDLSVDEGTFYMILKKILLYISNLEKSNNADFGYIKQIIGEELLVYEPINIKM